MTPLPSFKFRPNDTIVFGSEGRGIKPEMLALYDERVTIPQRNVTDSLSLAVSVGIVLFEFSAKHQLRRTPLPVSAQRGQFVRSRTKTREGDGGRPTQKGEIGIPTHDEK